MNQNQQKEWEQCFHSYGFAQKYGLFSTYLGRSLKNLWRSLNSSLPRLFLV